MGMFDHIICEYPLPDGFDLPDAEFQTKDLDNTLATYTITADGKLVHHFAEYEETPESELPVPEMPFIGCLRVKAGSEKMVEKDFHGDIYFYGSNISGSGCGAYVTEDDKPVWSREYRARFTDGKLTKLTLVSDAWDNGDLKHTTSKEWHKMIEESQKNES